MLSAISLIFVTVSFDSKQLEEIIKSRRKGGMHSHWIKYEDIIYRHLEKYHLRIHKNKDAAISAIEKDTKQTLPLDTFNSWWEKYKANKPLFILNK